LFLQDSALWGFGLDLMRPAEFDRGRVVQAAMRTHGVVVPPPGLDQDACFASGSEPFGVQAFVAQAPV
jgi:hypothetical protein